MAKVYEVIKATKQDMKGLAVKHKGAMKHLKFNKWGALRVKDKSLAHDLEQQHGYHNGEGAVVVAEVDQQVSNDPIHKFFFGGNPELPWKKNNPNYDKFGRRIDNTQKEKDDVQETSCQGRGQGRAAAVEQEAAQG